VPWTTPPMSSESEPSSLESESAQLPARRLPDETSGEGGVVNGAESPCRRPGPRESTCASPTPARQRCPWWPRSPSLVVIWRANHGAVQDVKAMAGKRLFVSRAANTHCSLGQAEDSMCQPEADGLRTGSSIDRLAAGTIAQQVIAEPYCSSISNSWTARASPAVWTYLGFVDGCALSRTSRRLI